jgi:hypothetical protein
MAPSDSVLSQQRSPARTDAPWDLDAPWIVDPPSRLTFSSDEEPGTRRLLRALGRRVRVLLHAATLHR